jgi:L-serine deaminase
MHIKIKYMTLIHYKKSLSNILKISFKNHHNIDYLNSTKEFNANEKKILINELKKTLKVIEKQVISSINKNEYSFAGYTLRHDAQRVYDALTNLIQDSKSSPSILFKSISSYETGSRDLVLDALAKSIHL